MRYFATLIMIIALTPATHALQVIEGQGRSYPIAETSQSQAIARQYQKASKNKQNRREVEKKWVVKLENPPATARQDRTRLVDITYTLPVDIKDKDGNVLIAKGHKHNPLAKMTMTSLIVIDGEKKEHIEWATKKKKAIGRAKILISKGSFLAIQRKHNLRVYHLKEQMVDRFRIKRVPCTVIQKGQKLEITEYRSPSL
jgi:conjugal transfer pilus assembly protein TraW